jgi:2-polyprenyl-3-methyl-5-hydroxy-6-metoxy-1,4-benzoquinol methylase
MRALLPQRCTKVLDVGCGDGRFAASIHNAEEVWGIETDQLAAEAASLRFYKVINGTFKDAIARLPLKYFDLVICNDVIEHMEDHEWFLDSVKTLIRDGGVLVASIPNVRYYKNLCELLLEKDWKYRDAGVLDRTHLRFFTEKSLRRTLSQHQYHIEEMRGINGGLSLTRSPRSLCAAVIVCGIIAITLGAWRDIRHLQFAVRALPLNR